MQVNTCLYEVWPRPRSSKRWPSNPSANLDELQTLFELCAQLTAKHELSSKRNAVSQHLECWSGTAWSVRSDASIKLHHLEPHRWRNPAAVADPESRTMKITLTSVLVDKQKKALAFYTESWGSRKRATSRRASVRSSPWCPRTTRKKKKKSTTPSSSTSNKST